MAIDRDPGAATSDASPTFQPVVVLKVAVTSQACDLGGRHLVHSRNPHVMHRVAVLPAERRAMHVARDGEVRPLAPEDALAPVPEPGLTIPVAGLLG